MDTQNYAKNPNSGISGASRQGTALAGAKRIRKGIERGELSRVLLAKDADPALTEPLEALAASQKIPVTWVDSMESLGKYCGIEVGTAAAAVRRK